MADDRKPRLEDYVSVPVVSQAVYAIVRRALDEANARTGAIEPTAVEKITPEQRFGLDMPSAKPEWEDEFLRPTPLMRRLGYTQRTRPPARTTGRDSILERRSGPARIVE